MAEAPQGSTPKESLEQSLCTAAAAGEAVKVGELLDLGVDVTFQDEQGMSALMHAADAGHKEVVAMLLEAGCPWNLQDHEGYCAGQYGAGYPEVAEMLLDWGVQAELVLGASERAAHAVASAGTSSSSTAATKLAAANTGYLQQKLHYTEDGTKLLDADGEAVMMGWERPIMARHAHVICARGGDIMNVGFGLGCIDEAIQEHQPPVSSHTIIEAHPDVHAHALRRGWGSKPGVHLKFGQWQEVVPQLLAEGKKYDGIFFDTYGEFWDEMDNFHHQLPKLLKPGGIYSFFNGMAPDNAFFNAVYGRLAQLELSRLGLTTSYAKVDIKEALDPAVWEGVRNRYWHLPYYMLPTCIFQPADR